jgi:hypothetical protein
MQILLWNILLATLSTSDLYIAEGLTYEQIRTELKAGTPIYAYLEEGALYLMPTSSTPPSGVRKIAEAIEPDQLVLVSLGRINNATFSLDDVPGNLHIYYRGERHWLIKTDAQAIHYLHAQGAEIRPLPKQPLKISLGNAIPPVPQDLPIIHQTIALVTPAQLQSYVQTLSDFISRYTTARTFVDAQNWALARFSQDYHLTAQNWWYPSGYLWRNYLFPPTTSELVSTNNILPSPLVSPTIPGVIARYHRNILAELPGETKPNEIVIVCAHEDSATMQPYECAPGADDNASGSAAVLMCAKLMADMRFERTIRFILFSAEEDGLIGSYYYAHAMYDAGANITGVLNMDMIAYKDDAVNDMDLGFSTTGLELINFINQCGVVYVPQLQLFLDTSGTDDASDHASFGDLGFQASESIEHPGTGWNPNYHTASDLPATLDYTYSAYCTQLNLAAAMELAGYLGQRYKINPAQNTPYVYPNPMRLGSGNRNLTFTNLSPGSDIKVYDLSGGLIWETHAQGASLVWAPNLASGVYLYHIKRGNSQFTGKIAIIR